LKSVKIKSNQIKLLLGMIFRILLEISRVSLSPKIQNIEVKISIKFINENNSKSLNAKVPEIISYSITNE